MADTTPPAGWDSSPKAPAGWDSSPIVKNETGNPNPMDNPGSADPAVSNVLRGAAKSTIGNAFDLLALPQSKFRKVLTGKDNYDEQSTELRKKLGIEKDYEDDRLFGVFPQPKPLANVERGILDSSLGVLTDPTSIISAPLGALKGRSLAGHALDLAERHGFSSAVKGASKIAGKMKDSPNPLVANFPDAVAGIHDLGVDSKVKRDLARLYGPKWKDEYARLYGIRNRGLSQENSFERAALPILEKVTKGATNEDLDKVFSAIYSNSIDRLPRPLKVRALAYRRLTDTLAAAQGDEQVRGLAARSRIVPEMQPHVSGEPRGIQDVEQTRGMQENSPTGYVATKSQGKKSGLFGDRDAGGETSVLSTFDRHLLPQNEGYVGVQNTLDATRRRINSAARTTAAHDTRLRLGVRPENMLPQHEETFFDRNFGQPDKENYWLHAAKTATDFDKGGLFAFPFRHMANVASHAVIEDPIAFGKGATAFAKSMATREPEAQRLARFKKATDAGAIVTQSADRQSPFVGAIEEGANRLARLGPAGKAVASLPGGLKNIYKGSSGVLWHFDDELKNASFHRKIAAGMSEPEAALQVGADMVDYANRSGLASRISPVVPFASWRTKAPQVALRLAVQYPARVNAAGRAAPAFLGGKQQGPDGKNYTSGLPFAEAGQITEGSRFPGDAPGAARYVRGSLGPIARAPIGAAIDSLSPGTHKGGWHRLQRKDNARHWMTSGTPVPEYIGWNLPGAQLLGQLPNMGQFPKTPLQDLLGQLGIEQAR